MSRTTNWMQDVLRGESLQATKYYRTFNAIYYKHKKPTIEDCSVLNISMERAEVLRREGYKIENEQRTDAQNFSIKCCPSEYERVTNRKRKQVNLVDTETP